MDCFHWSLVAGGYNDDESCVLPAPIAGIISETNRETNIK